MFKNVIQRLVLPVVLAYGGSVHADVTTLWVDGVTQETGWYDVNKTFDTDKFMCWAASASNLIAWWQSDYPVRYDIPNTPQDIWDTFKTSALQDAGGDTQAAIQWWLTGVYVPLTEAEADRSCFSMETESVLPAFGGYYYDADLTGENGYYCTMSGFNWVDTGSGQIIESVYGVYHFLCMDEYPRVTENGQQYISRAFDSELLLELIGKGCGFGLGVSFENTTVGHALTLWGLEHDADNNISAMYITDSDDGRTALRRVETYTQDGILYLAAGENGYGNGAKVDTLFAINPTVADNWPSAHLIAPEPSGAMLAGLALLAAALRRRRPR